MSTTAKRFTAEELLALPDDGVRRELISGEVKMMTPAGHTHGEIAMEIALALGNYVKSERLGKVYAAETGFKLESDPDMVRAPDVAFISTARLPAPDFAGYPEMAPDLAVEVLSPSDAFVEVEEKARCWLEHGSREVWVIDPQNRRVLVYRPDGAIRDLSPEDTLEGGELLPGFRLRVEDIFKR